MNSKLLALSTTFLFIISIKITAQTVLQANNIPMAGDLFGNKTITDTTIQPGSGGTNQVWDYSVYFVNPSVISEAFSVPASTGNDALFPNSNLKATSVFGGTDYYSRSINQLQYIGYKDQSLELIVSNQQKLLSVPLAYGDSIVNVPVTGTGIFGYPLSGTISVKADGQGNLTLFTGSFPNTLRVVTNFDLIIGAGTGNDTHVEILKYTWYTFQYRNPVFQIATLRINGNLASVTQKVVTVGLGVSGIEPVKNDLNLSVSPNPANDFATVSFDKISSKGCLNIYDVTGKIISSQSVETGSDRLELDVRNLTRGIYLLSLIEGNTISRRKLVIG
jgi:hypothetical protein